MYRIIIYLIFSLFNFAVWAQVNPMYIGTYTSNGSEGVYIYDFDERTGDSRFVQSIVMSNPSFLARKADVLYAVNENSNGQITAYELNKGEVLNQFQTKGAHPCHVSLSPNQPLLVVSNYSGGSLVLYSVNVDGSINKEEDFLQFNKSSVNESRQTNSHIHSSFFSEDGNSLFVSDLGADVVYHFGIEKNQFGYKLNLIDEINVKLGGGPRHVVVSEDANRLFVVLELTGEIEVLEKTANNWVSKQIIPIFSKGFTGEHGAADIKISADGKYIYATNRGTSNEIAVYKVAKNGTLKSIQVLSVEGDSPRNVQISPTGKWIIVSNQISGSVTFFMRNAINGKLSKSKHTLSIPSPVCVVF